MYFRDLKTQYEHIKQEVDKRIQDVINSTEFIFGQPVGELEQKLADYVGTKHCISCANGTDALQLSLMSWGIGKGDAVFTSDFTYIASAGAPSLLGATPILVDIDLRTFNISPDALEKSIKRVINEGKLKPKVIIPVDLFGLPADYTKIEVIARKYGLKILEDGAQGFGGNLNGKRACSFGDISITSFFPSKPLGCYGDGGAIFTNDDESAAMLRSLRSQGKTPYDKYDNRIIGINSRLDTIQAAILIAKLKVFIDFELEAVNKVANWYSTRLDGKFITPLIPQGYYSSWAQYSILFDSPEQRVYIQKKLKDKYIPSVIYYPRGLHQQEVYKSMKYKDDEFPNTMKATQTVLSLPMHPYLDEKTVDLITKIIID